MFFDNYSPSNRMKKPVLKLDRSDSPYDMGKKGTVQHDILEGEYSDPFLRDDNFTIRVNCKEDASGFSKKEKIRYCIAVTLEVDEKVRPNCREYPEVHYPGYPAHRPGEDPEPTAIAHLEELRHRQRPRLAESIDDPSAQRQQKREGRLQLSPPVLGESRPVPQLKHSYDAHRPQAGDSLRQGQQVPPGAAVC